jgi:hypothetical protein
MEKKFVIRLQTGDFVAKRYPRFGKSQSSLMMTMKPKRIRQFADASDAKALIEPIRVYFGLNAHVEVLTKTPSKEI